MPKTKIEWTGITWNPITGCTKISSGCKNCYAEKMSFRLKSMRKPKYRNGFSLTLHEDVLEEPFHVKKPSMIFVNSMSDLFHENLPIEFIQKVFRTMNENPQHTFQVLTKRADLLLKHNDKLIWTDNIWMGVTVESAEYIDRIDMLSQTGAKLKFLSLEPLLSALPNLHLDLIDWVIVGGESGAGARPMQEEWVIDIQKQCIEQTIPFFFKQWGCSNKKKNSKLLNGQIIQNMPR